MRKFTSLLFIILVLSQLCLLPIAASQETNQVAENDEAAPASTIKTLPPVYTKQMLRLAEMLGSLHYLRNLCGANEGQTWRDEMKELLIAEEPSAARKAQLTAHFNRGFRSYHEIYRECTPPAVIAANQYLKLGTKLAAEIPNRYGN